MPDNTGMSSASKWDYALRLSGVQPQSIPMAKLAEYMEKWAALLGAENTPVFAGMVKGSVVLRARVGDTAKNETHQRLRNAPYDKNAAKLIADLERMAARDGIKGQILDAQGGEILRISPPSKPLFDPIIVADSGEIDGEIFRISGKDSTTSVGVLEHGSGQAISIEVRDDALARQLAQHFKAGPVRIYVHGTWMRNESGEWEPKALYADRMETLDNSPALEILSQLGALPGGWKDIQNPEDFIAQLRSGI